MSQRTHSTDDEEDLSSCIHGCKLPFSKLPFDDVDSLVLSSLSYLNFSSYPLEEVSTQERVPLIDILRFSGFSDLTCGTWLKEGDDVEAFLVAVATSVRYRDLSISFFAQEDSLASTSNSAQLRSSPPICLLISLSAAPMEACRGGKRISISPTKTLSLPIPLPLDTYPAC